jgi:hypothetical protein
MSGPRRIGIPRQVAVRVSADGRPLLVGGQVVETIRETWLLEDRWWTERPMRRRYWELITSEGRNTVIFHDIIAGRWWRQR